MVHGMNAHWRPADTLGTRLVLIRRQLNLSQRAAAEQTGISFGAWQSMEDDRSPHRMLWKVQRIAETFDVDRDWLMWGGPLRSPDLDTEGHSRHRKALTPATAA